MNNMYSIPKIKNYLISKQGEVFSVKSNKFIKPLDTGRGYKHYILFINGSRKAYFRHKLLAITFISNPDNKSEVDHINGIAGDDRLENLRWVTRKENVQYWHNEQKVKLRKPLLVRDLVNNVDLNFNNHLEAAKHLNVHRYEVLRRLNCKFGVVFKDKTQVKWLDDNRELPFIEDIDKSIKEHQRINAVKLYNHITKEMVYFDKMVDAAKFLNVSPSTLTTKINVRVNKIFSSGWEVKFQNDDTEWTKIDANKLERILSGSIDNRPIVLTHHITGKRYIFKTSKEACKLIGGTPTKVWYRLTKNKTNPCRDGFTYEYLFKDTN